MRGESFETGKLGNMLAAFVEYQDAQREVQDCFLRHDTDADYFCGLEIEARQVSANEFGKRLKEFVMDCIREDREGNPIKHEKEVAK